MRNLAQRLVEAGKLQPSGLDRALRVNEETGENLASALTKLGLVSEIDLAAAYAETLGLKLVARTDFPTEPLFEDRLSLRFLQQARVVPMEQGPDGVVLAMADPLDRFVIDAVRMAAGAPVEVRVATPADIEAALHGLYDGGGDRAADITGGDGGVDAEADVERLRDLASEAPVIRLVNRMIERAVEQRASDIHIEPFEGRIRVRYRVDGVLREAESPADRLAAAIVSRIKIMARLNIAERRLPQDGRIKVVVRGKEFDLRVSTTPSLHGESVVMRILDRDGAVLDFKSLGFLDDTLKIYLSVLERPHGILLVTGPTGSGKTTTLYTSLMRLNSPERKILTVEDPVEYQLDGVLQVQVKPDIELTFARALRSFLRQDPDIMMIGEIRDLETAQIGVQAALTGHLVLSTLHTNDAAGAIARLMDMGVPDYLLTSTINGVAAQRLVRKLCPHCREAREPDAELLDRLGAGDEPPRVLYHPTGCDKCNGGGYSGRSALLEVLVMDDTLRRLVLKRADAHEIEQAAIEGGMMTIYRDGLRKAAEGITSIEEVLRVTWDG
ncbi:MAG: type II secretion system ATPase GspE [Proteobacteria bacterium]|nr:type II secretion system ATPase GspE [Pseudomonadota bacterium]MCK4866640.1 type II secretion system ATPase GspE [Alphaproteobacteria bacterium]